MDKLKVSLTIVLVILFLYLYTVRRKPSHPRPMMPADAEIDFNKMSDGEKLEYVIRVYFSSIADNPVDEQTIKENNYLKALPQDTSCADTFSSCDMWARNGECTVNPEFMAYNCKKSCKTCKLTPEQLYYYTIIHNSRDSDTCVYRGTNYPDITAEYIRKYRNI